MAPLSAVLDLGQQASAPRVTVSVVSHGQRSLVASLLAQLADLHDSDIGRVVVVHNLPDDELPRPQHAEFELLQMHNEKPLGFSANHNRAFAHCATPWFAVLNPDIDFHFDNPFPVLFGAVAAEPRLGAVAPVLLQPGTLHAEPNRGVVTPLELIRRRLPGWRPPAEPSWLVGAFMMVRADVFASLDGFDERFRLYCEDIDLGLRVRDEGWGIQRVNGARVVHQTQRSSHRRFKYTLMHLISLLQLWFKLLRDCSCSPHF
ncbi:glycosyltransferase [Thiomonas sp. FB-Cd]|uniref:glycosyltransferase n=1 Tax=Thiomonas sp. FB-Cd TaxID=1158292 RepID=UPI00068C8C82|nr:glycosyltransferase [Thiomonas sp. FB-Cd]